MALLKVKDHPDVVKDDNTKALLITDNNALSAYRKRRDQHRQMETVCQEIDDIKKDISELKGMLTTVINTFTETKGVK